MTTWYEKGKIIYVDKPVPIIRKIRKADLERRIEELEARVAELEKRLGSFPVGAQVETVEDVWYTRDYVRKMIPKGRKGRIVICEDEHRLWIDFGQNKKLWVDSHWIKRLDTPPETPDTSP